jgi:hypothetical protein
MKTLTCIECGEETAMSTWEYICREIDRWGFTCEKCKEAKRKLLKEKQLKWRKQRNKLLKKK